MLSRGNISSHILNEIQAMTPIDVYTYRQLQETAFFSWFLSLVWCEIDSVWKIILCSTHNLPV